MNPKLAAASLFACQLVIVVGAGAADRPFSQPATDPNCPFAGSSIEVDTTADSGLGSLRQAILCTNAAAGANTILFSIGSGAQTITPASPLPDITGALTIDGTSQDGFTGTPLIRLDQGSGAGTALVVAAGPSVIRGLEITRWGTAIHILAPGTKIEGNYIGTDGASSLGNGAGIDVESKQNTIGGTSADQSNVISGNVFDGIDISGTGAISNLVENNLIGTNSAGTAAVANDERGVAIFGGATNNAVRGNVVSGNEQTGVELSGSGTSGNQVVGNYIGTNDGGTSALANGANGVTIVGPANKNTIGGTAEGDINVISGNTGGGVTISGAGATGNAVEGNVIGANTAGTAAVPNGLAGVSVYGGATGNTIGGTVTDSGNVISGNAAGGVGISDAGTTGNLVERNYIGTNAAGTADIGNGDGCVGGAGCPGVELYNGATGNTVGGTAADVGNLISGNSNYGVNLRDAGTNGNLVAGNLIGTDAAGAAPIPNAGGVGVGFGAQKNVVGGTTADAANVISGNTVAGIELIGTGTSGNLVEGNHIGVDGAGTTDLGNGAGIAIYGGATSNTIGGTAAGARNVISGNSGGAGDGILIFDAGTSGNLVQGNYLGTDAGGAKALANDGNGVDIYGGATKNTIGGTTAAARNVISGNSFSAVGIAEAGTSSNVVEGNYIGTDAGGTKAVTNNGRGVVVFQGATKNTIGGTTAAARNVISGNSSAGVSLEDAGTSGNLVEGNYIGVDESGAATIFNSGNGVQIFAGAAGNTVGGTAAGARNVISGNTGSGVSVSGTGTKTNLVRGNYIGPNAAGTAAFGNGNGFSGVAIFGGATNNTVGGTSSATRNVISGNSNGVGISDPGTSGNLVEANYIGTNAAGTGDLGNPGAGVFLFNGATSNTIGGSSSGARNLISGNDGLGVGIRDAGTSLNVVKGNWIGTTAAGTAALANGSTGVAVFNKATKNTIGGTSSGARNVVSGNTGGGIGISGAGTTGNLVEGNYVGTNAAGNAVVANTSSGIAVFGGAATNTVGGTSAGARNLVSGNTGGGIGISGAGTTGNLVQGNYVGTNAAGTAALANGSAAGVSVYGKATKNTVGGGGAGAGNVISGNQGLGVGISGSGTTGNVVAGNLIGTNAAGTSALKNGTYALAIFGAATKNTVGGTADGTGNVISASSYGVDVQDAGTTGNAVEGNNIGTDAAGTGAIPNTVDGVLVWNGASNNTIGGKTAGADNAISFSQAGVQVDGGTTLGDSILGNSIAANSSIGIALTSSGNGGVAAPTITSVSTTASKTTIKGTVAGGSQRVEVFDNATCGDPEGDVLLGAVTTSSGTWTLAVGPLGAGVGITATATNNSTHNTSEFSSCEPAP